MIISELTSGLGNQLFQYAAAKSLALQTNQKLVLDNHFFTNNSYRIPRLDLFQHSADYTIPHNAYVYKLFAVVRRLFKRRFITVQEKEWWRFSPFDTDLINAQPFVYLQGGWCSYNYFEPYANIIRSSLALKETYKKRIAALQYRIRKEQAVAVHIRKGDYVNSADASSIFFNLGIDYYVRAMQQMATLVEQPVFYVFTNDVTWVEQQFKPVISFPCVYVSEQDTWEDYEEFELMRSCKHQIIANSTFSWWAAFLNDHPAKIIIQPENWYNTKAAQENYERGMLIGNIGRKL